jgi:hypothetical protein
MNRKSPIQIVAERFGTKAALAEKLIPVLDRRAGEEDEEFAQRIRTSSNRQLLRLLAAHERTESEFSGKAGLVQKISELKLGRVDSDYTTKLSKYARTRLLDLHDSLARRARKTA